MIKAVRENKVVERKETLFSISKRYGINVNDILKLNPNLRDSRLRRRSTILIPIFKSSKLEYDIRQTKDTRLLQ